MDRKLETVTSFKYLDSVINDEGSKPDILSSIAETAAVTRFETSLECQEYFSQFQDTTDALTSIFLYACE